MDIRVTLEFIDGDNVEKRGFLTEDAQYVASKEFGRAVERTVDVVRGYVNPAAVGA